HAKDFISVDNENVYWEDTVQCLEKGDKTYYMVHLLNPASDWSATTWPEKYHKDFNVTINTDKKVRAYILSPDFGADNSFRIDCGETKTVNVPHLAVWDVVIFETEK
ncbi:MAG: hypothetical protein KBT47_08965, partial [Armatimonadetes bacterium]|nr:hypothetical protein [Candidatus Hippobium faecium]